MRRRAVAAADEHARHRLLGQRERAPERADDVDLVVRGAAAASHSVPLPCAANDDLEGAAVDAAALDRVDRERAAQQHRGLLAADAERDEVPGPGELGDAGRRERQHVVGTGPADPEHLAGDLRRLLTDAVALRLAALIGAGRPVAAGACAAAGREVGACSCSDRTPISPAISASMPCTAAARPCTVVMHGTPLGTAAVRIS